LGLVERLRARVRRERERLDADGDATPPGLVLAGADARELREPDSPSGAFLEKRSLRRVPAVVAITQEWVTERPKSDRHAGGSDTFCPPPLGGPQRESLLGVEHARRPERPRRDAQKRPNPRDVDNEGSEE